MLRICRTCTILSLSPSDTTKQCYKDIKKVITRSGGTEGAIKIVHVSVFLKIYKKFKIMQRMIRTCTILSLSPSETGKQL